MAKVKAPTLPCPKCGDTGWDGPRYHREYDRAYGWVEHLKFTCVNCGYVKGIDCADHYDHD